MVNSEFISPLFKDTILPEYCSRCKNPRTRTEYIGYLRILCDKFAYKDFLDITADDARRVVNEMYNRVRDGKLSNKTVCVRLACYSAVAKFIEKEYPELEYTNPFKDIERPYIEDRVDRYAVPSIEEVDELLSQAKSQPMYYLIIALSVRAGLSASQIVRLKKDSIIEHKGHLVVYIQNKTDTRKDKTIILPEDVSAILRKYLENLSSIDSEGHIFYNSHHRPLTLKNLDSGISRIVEKAGLERKYTLKDLRARAVLDLIDSGASEEVIHEYVGIGPMRTRQFFDAIGIARGCPTDLVNFQIKVPV